MSELSARLSLPYLQPAQAQKHVTHNEALERLDMLVQLSVEEFDATTPPITAQDGQVWALGPVPDGDWAGQEGKLAQRTGEGWLFVTPRSGWVATQGNGLRIFTGSDWHAPGLGDLQNLSGLGIGASPDAANPLVVAGAGALFTHDGAGHQLKLNKATSGDTASLLMQTDWSGRAEIGLTGNDDLSFKISADGAAWLEALVVEASDGQVDMPHGLRIEGQPALHRGNLLGTVGESAGQPTGAVIEQGESATGSYLRLADGTQLCMATLNAGDPTAQGAGSFTDPFRTAPQAWTFPRAFVAAPVVTGYATTSSNSADDRRMVFSSEPASATAVGAVQAARFSASSGDAACMISLLAVGRWF